LNPKDGDPSQSQLGVT